MSRLPSTVKGFGIDLPFRFITRDLGTQETRSNDILSVLLFQPEYLKRLLDLGYADGEACREEIAAFLGRSKASGVSAFRDERQAPPAPANIEKKQ